MILKDNVSDGPAFDESRISYAQLIDFIDHKMDMHANYQPVVIKTIVERGGSVTRDVIEDQLDRFNPDSNSKSMTNTVLSVLKENRILRKDRDNYLLNLDRPLKYDDIQSIIALCNEQIRKFERGGQHAVELEEHDYAPVLKRFLEGKYNISIEKVSRANLKLPSGSIIHAKGAGREIQWQDLAPLH